MARRKQQQPLEVDPVVDYSSHGVKPRGPLDEPLPGRTNPRHDWSDYVRRQESQQQAPETSGERWDDLAATARRYAEERSGRAIDIRAMIPMRAQLPATDSIGRSTPRRRRSDS